MVVAIAMNIRIRKEDSREEKATYTHSF